MITFDVRYPHSNVRLILNKLDEVISTESVKTLMARFMAEDSEADAGTIHERMFRTILREFIGYELSEHELITLTRHFRQADLRQERLPEETLFALLQNELKRAQVGFRESTPMSKLHQIRHKFFPIPVHIVCSIAHDVPKQGYNWIGNAEQEDRAAHPCRRSGRAGESRSPQERHHSRHHRRMPRHVSPREVFRLEHQ